MNTKYPRQSEPSLVRTGEPKIFWYKSRKNHIYLNITLELDTNKSQTSVFGSILYFLFGLKRFGQVWYGLSRSHFIDTYRKCFPSLIGTEILWFGTHLFGLARVYCSSVNNGNCKS